MGKACLLEDGCDASACIAKPPWISYRSRWMAGRFHENLKMIRFDGELLPNWA